MGFNFQDLFWGSGLQAFLILNMIAILKYTEIECKKVFAL